MLPTIRSAATDFVPNCIESIRHVGTLPSISFKIIELTNDPESTIGDIKSVIECDPALASRILKVVNSSFYGVQGKVNSIERAILLLGLTAVRNIAVAASMHKLFAEKQLCDRFSVADLWAHSVAVATVTQFLAERTQLVSADEAFLAGLIHDIGIIVELQTSLPQFAEVIAMLGNSDELSFLEAEERIFGATHEVIGAALCRAWHIPRKIEYASGFHHRPWEIEESERVLPALVNVADAVAARVGIGYTRTVDTIAIDERLLGFLMLDSSDLESASDLLPNAAEEIMEILGGRPKQHV